MEFEAKPLDVLTLGEMVVDFTSEFRSGDYLLTPDEVSEKPISRTRVIHASTFALSREPCRSAVTRAFRKAREMGGIVSLDPNYSRRVWPEAVRFAHGVASLKLRVEGHVERMIDRESRWRRTAR